jgi:V/A-type H+-transporting ATPase subunit A
MPSLLAINGPVLTVGGSGFSMAEVVKIGGKLGEVIALKADEATVQLYESPSGLDLSEVVEKTGKPMSVTMRPGVIGGIFDGIFRELGDSSPAGFDVEMQVEKGQFLGEGAVYATVRETDNFTYRAMIPAGVEGTVIFAEKRGVHEIGTTLVALKTEEGKKSFTIEQTWPIRVARPVKTRLECSEPLITGQRVIDSLFPIAKGGTCAIPGGFGTGKTMTQHQIAKWCNADIIVYIGCGERGNEMTEVLDSFSELKDPRTGAPLMSRTVLIANTSDMPVAAREASIYTGITVAEFYRDMGCDVVLLADSTSRWAEALRELTARLGEIPAEEGYPAYLGARIAAFYARAGAAETLSGAAGSITIIGAVSPQGSDFTEPVTQHTKRVVQNFWALDKSLAHARHFPSINWINSYSSSVEAVCSAFDQIIKCKYLEARGRILEILFREHALLETVKLVGTAALSPEERLILAAARHIRENFLRQNAYDPADSFTPLEKQIEMMQILCANSP